MTEAEWDREARALALALDHYEATLCPCGCGLPASVSQDPENEDRFVVDLPIRCHAKTALLRAGDAIGDGAQHAEALLFDRPTLKGASRG